MKNIQELLIYSLDNELNEIEKAQLKSALESSFELRAEQNKLLKMRNLITGFSIREDKGFSKRVLQKIQFLQKKKTDFGENIVVMFPKVAAACAVILLMTLAAVQLTDLNLSSNALVGVESLNLEDALVYLEN